MPIALGAVENHGEILPGFLLLHTLQTSDQVPADRWVLARGVDNPDFIFATRPVIGPECEEEAGDVAPSQESLADLDAWNALVMQFHAELCASCAPLIDFIAIHQLVDACLEEGWDDSRHAGWCHWLFDRMARHLAAVQA